MVHDLGRMVRAISKRWVSALLVLVVLGVVFDWVRPDSILRGRNSRTWVGELTRPRGNLSGAIEAFQQMGPEALPLLKELLETGHSTVREAYAEKFAMLPRKLQAMLPDPSLDAVAIRARAVAAIGKLGVHARPAIPWLHQAVTDADAQVRIQAVVALGVLHAEATDDTVLLLSAALFDAEPLVRENACYSLAGMGPRAASAVPVLGRVVRESDEPMRLLAIGALEAIGSDTDDVIPILDEASRSGAALVRERALRAMQNLGGPPETKESP